MLTKRHMQHSRFLGIYVYAGAMPPDVMPVRTLAPLVAILIQGASFYHGALATSTARVDAWHGRNRSGAIFPGDARATPEAGSGGARGGAAPTHSIGIAAALDADELGDAAWARGAVAARESELGRPARERLSASHASGRAHEHGVARRARP